jgi:hypothetical protein
VTPMDIGDFLTHTLPDRCADIYIADQLGALRSFFDFLYLELGDRLLVSYAEPPSDSARS